MLTSSLEYFSFRKEFNCDTSVTLFFRDLLSLHKLAFSYTNVEVIRNFYHQIYYLINFQLKLSLGIFFPLFIFFFRWLSYDVI